MMRYRLYRYLLPLATALCLTSCESGLLSKLGVDNPSAVFESAGLPGMPGSADTREKMVVNRVDFSPDYKTFSVWTGVLDDIGPYPLTNPDVVRIEVESYDSSIKSSRRELPRLVKAWNTERDNVKKLNVKLLVLADLSLSQEQIDAQRDAVEEILTVFDEEDVYIAFMSGDAVTPTRQVTDYILNMYFKEWSSQKLLYRSMLTKIQELKKGGEPWLQANSVKLLVFSDGRVYDKEDVPMDPEHFKTENDLINALEPGQEDIGVFYVNFGKVNAPEQEDESRNIISSVCEKNGGAFFPHFSWTLLEESMLGPDVRRVASNRFDFVNPDGKVYRGDNSQLVLKFYSIEENRLLASATANINEGSLYNPIIVNGAPLRNVILEGLGIGLFIMLLIYLAFQFIVPYIRYRIFLKKHVVRHTGKKMAIGAIAVAESCYLCKAPFVEGDEVVVKCEHTMHKSCWDENEYHCPEYGRHCKHGSHFYDKENLFDRRNASYLLKWLLMAVVAALLAWMCFTIVSHFMSRHILEYLMPEEFFLRGDGTHLNELPFSAFSVSFFLTLGIAWLAFPKRWLLNAPDLLLRALVAGVGTAILYLLLSAACIALNLQSISFLLNLIPWALSSVLIAFIGTYGSRIKLKRYIFLIALAVSLLSMYLWSAFYMLIGVDFRVLILYSFILYTVGIALAVGSVAPHSEHYFLHTSGAVKSMDVALYKWFRANPRAVVSIGRSVDCSLQLSWDLKGNVAPVHAEITMNRGVLRLKALEEGVLFNGKPLPVEKYKNLYHGYTFQIGQTLFTYEEKDI